MLNDVIDKVLSNTAPAVNYQNTNSFSPAHAQVIDSNYTSKLFSEAVYRKNNKESVKQKETERNGKRNRKNMRHRTGTRWGKGRG